MAKGAQRDIHFKFWVLAIVNWCIAILCWGISAYLGMVSPTGIFVYTTLFIVAMVAMIVGILAWLVARFGRETAVRVGRRARLARAAVPHDERRVHGRRGSSQRARSASRA